MAKNDNLKDFLSDVADAIREKKGTSEPINPQEFSNEIKGIESGSPFAVDFGEEIATGNPTFINALQEDIDYYNEVVRKLNSGEIKEADVLKEPIKHDLAWIPPKVTPPNSVVDFWRLRELKTQQDLFFINNVNPVSRAYLIEHIEAPSIDARNTTINLGENNEISKSIRIIKIKNPISSECLLSFAWLKSLKVVEIDTKNVLSFQLMWRSTRIPKIQLDLLSATNVTNMFFGTMCDEVYLSNLGISLSMSNLKTLTMESVKFILDHCQEKAETYTLTLNASVKTAFLAKCDEDAEYAASLAAANAKGLSIA